MKLQTSKLCVNCETLYEGIGSCPYCGSEVVVWLFRALGTAIEANTEEDTNCTLTVKEDPASHSQAFPSDPPRASFGDRTGGAGSFTEFRTAINRMGREMVKVLTFGLMACK